MPRAAGYTTPLLSFVEVNGMVKKFNFIDVPQLSGFYRSIIFSSGVRSNNNFDVNLHGRIDYLPMKFNRKVRNTLFSNKILIELKVVSRK